MNTINVITLTEQQLVELLTRTAELAVEKYREAHPAEPAAGEKFVLTTEEVAAKLGVTRQTICAWAGQGRLRRYHIGGRAYFKWPEVQHDALVADLPPDGRRRRKQRKNFRG